MASEHLGLAYIAAVLRHHGVECVILPSSFPQSPPSAIHIPRVSDSEQELIQCIVRQVDAQDIDVIGVSIPFQEDSVVGLELATAFKKSHGNAKVLVGGHFPSFNSHSILRDYSFVDGVVVGEGEYTLLDVANQLRVTGQVGPVPGLVLRGSTYSARELVTNLDTLPPPARDTLAWMKDEGYPVREAYISGSRGCYGNCAYCSVRSFYALTKGPRWRGRSPESIFDEMVSVRDKYGISTFCFSDDQFLGPGENGAQRGRRIAHLLASDGGFSFRFSCRANDVNEGLFRAFADAGLDSVFLGIESGNDAGLRRLRKGLTVRDNLAAISVLRDLGIAVMPGFIAIAPWTTLEDLQSDLCFLQETGILGPLGLLRRKLRIYSGTDIETILHRSGDLEGDYRWYDYRISDPRVDLILLALDQYSARMVPRIEEKIRASPTSLDRAALALRHQQARALIITKILSAGTLFDCYELYNAVKEEVRAIE